MRKVLLLLGISFVCFFQVKAQKYVSTEPSNKNVIIEEFTGKECVNCPQGHVIANEIMAEYPDRVWTVGIHAGFFSDYSYPNLNTYDGDEIHYGFGVTGYPTGLTNRSMSYAVGVELWSDNTEQQLNQAAVLNVAGVADINPDTRVATIEVEVYYTGNNTQATNYLTVAMLQDSILGYQSGASSNPSQMVGDQYCHMHILRDIITPSAWGAAISPTTQGTLITKTYTYEIPEIIGDPDGVEVDINNIFFLAWVAESQQNGVVIPILSACKLETVIEGVEVMTVSTSDATLITTTEAVVGGSFANGTPSEVGVMYRAAEETTFQEAAAATVLSEFEVQLTGLTHDTEYVYKAFARTDDGQEVFGEEKSFTTEFNAIDENAGVNCNIYPNPSKGVVCVEGVDIAKVMVSNSLGQLVDVVESKGNCSTINIENLSVGVYFINVINNKGETTTKKISVVK